MKIICDCGNQIELSTKNEKKHYKIINGGAKYGKWNDGWHFTHIYNGNASLVCDRCTAKITW